MSQTPNTTGTPAVRRRSQRVLMQVAVRVRGKDSQGHAFDEETETLAINAHGALILVNARVTSGSKMMMQHKRTQEEQECHVVFLGPVRGGKAEIGLEFSEPAPHLLARRVPLRGLVVETSGCSSDHAHPHGKYSRHCLARFSFIFLI